MTRPRPQQPAALSAALSGAVDLSGLKARAEAARTQTAAGDGPNPTDRAADGAPAAAAPPEYGQFVIEITEANLQQVIEQSTQVPVILEFWMANADQAQQYGDLLIRLAEEGQGTWLLGRVEVESQMRVAQAMRLQGVPAVRALFQGQMVAEFDGLQPEQQVREFLKAVVDGTGGALPEGAGPAEDPRVDDAETALAAGDLERAEELYSSLLADQPAHPLAKDAITQIQLMKRLDSEADSDPSSAVADADASPDDLELAFKAADQQIAAGDYEPAFERVLRFVRGDDADNKEKARERLIELFAIVGNGEPAVAAARRELASALF